MSKQKLLYVFLAAIFIGGCSLGLPRFNVNIDSISSPQAPSSASYVLIPGNENTTWDDLQFQEYASYVIRALSSQGYYLADSIEEAELAIMLSYGIGDPETSSYSFSLPVYGQTGVASSNTYGTATTYGNTTTLNATTINTPSYGITGYNTYTGSNTNYFRFALITAYDFQEFQNSEREVQVWRTTITSTGSSGDLRRVFPVMIGASTPYFGINTGQEVDVTVSESDESVLFIKGQDR